MDPFGGLLGAQPTGNPYTFANSSKPVWQSTRLAQPKAPGPAMTAPPASLGQMVKNKIASAVAPATGQRFASSLADLTDYTPVGAMTQGFQFGQDLRNSNVGGAVANGIGTALNVLPVGGVAHAMFLGAMARGADKLALRKAEGMFAGGASRDDVWNQTGWFKGIDGKPRFEIDDNPLSVGMGEGRLGDVVSHPSLFSAYPSMADESLRNSDRMGASFQRAYMDGDYLPGEISLGRQGSPDQQRSILAHELQHGVQDQEGFAAGGTPESFRLGIGFKSLVGQDANDALVLRKMANGHHGGDVDAAKGTFSNIMGRDPTALAVNAAKSPSFDDQDLHNATDSLAAYKRLAGEVEARNVQTRLKMWPDERKVTPPWLTEDVAPEHQIVRFTATGGR